ncbi:MspA family porin [Nocardia sp. NPDC088792]|uniref:MspA family porin n=1 Tax=Nocardia sp. NPDC088792 TaxID=3364332 RepID=UPI0038270E60
MLVKTAIAGVIASAVTVARLITGPAGVAHADTLPSHEKTVTAPNGMTVTVGHRDNAVRPVAPLNGMPTNREAYLDNTSYGRVEGGIGKLRTGFFIACAVDLDVSFDINATAGIGADVSGGVTADLTGVTPSASVAITPTIGANIGVDLSIRPGKIVDVELPPELREKELPANDTGYIIDRDYRLTVQNCGGPLTVQAYTVIEASSPEANVAEYVLGDPEVL